MATNSHHPVLISKIISRYYKSIGNCIALVPYVDRLYVYDNSTEGTNARLLFRLAEGKLVKRYVDYIPEWAKPILPKE
jgi:predicted ABC-type ATPase